MNVDLNSNDVDEGGVSHKETEIKDLHDQIGKGIYLAFGEQ